jgi:O-6-methylguanine DNA methyltransferase
MPQTAQIVWRQSSVDQGRTLATFPSELGWMCCCWQADLLRHFTFGHKSSVQAQQATLSSLATERTKATAAGAAAKGARGKSDESGSPGASGGPSELLRPYEPTDEQESLVRRLADFAAGTADSFRDVGISLDGMTPFQKRVVGCCRRVSWGEVVSYGELARRAGRPGAARAVGTVMSRNRFPLIVPCHRVVGSQGELGGFSAPDGTRMKVRLLQQEGSMPSHGLPTGNRRKPR